ncbi:50S ribosomal protein L18, partial [Salmonella enterica]|uniref:50S ribosomal protein L18 n=1 Tax=Salmonella enterica TaxID=28901 RepID=UPI00398C6AA4
MDKKAAGDRRGPLTSGKIKELGATLLVLHRTERHIYAQVMAPKRSEVLVAATTVEKAIAEQLKYTGNKYAVAAVGKAVAERPLEQGSKDGSFDRSGFQDRVRVMASSHASRGPGPRFYVMGVSSKQR